MEYALFIPLFNQPLNGLLNCSIIENNWEAGGFLLVISLLFLFSKLVPFHPMGAFHILFLTNLWRTDGGHLNHFESYHDVPSSLP